MTAALAPAAWTDARAHPRDRDPDGRSLRNFRWGVFAEEPAGVMLFPRLALEPGTEPPGVLARRAWLVRTPDRPNAFCYWIAHALRQELWRLMQARSGFLPVAQVTLSGNGVEAVAAGLGSGSWGNSREKLDALFRSAGDWTAWAHSKSRRTGEH